MPSMANPELTDVQYDGRYRVTYETSDGAVSGFKCSPEMGRLIYDAWMRRTGAPLANVFHKLQNVEFEPDEHLISAALARHAVKRDEFEYITTFYPAFSSEQFGTSGVVLWFVLRGKLGVVTFCVLTNWYQSAVSEILNAEIANLSPGLTYAASNLMNKPLAADIGFHSPRHFDGGKKNECCWLEQGHCYYSGSSLLADEVFNILLKFGSDGVWNYMRGYYEEQFTAAAILEEMSQ